MTLQPDPHHDGLRRVSAVPDDASADRLGARSAGSGDEPRSLTAFDIVVVGVVAIALATLLNADGLAARARGLPVSSSLRAPTVSLTKALVRVTHTLGIDRPADALNRYRGDAGDKAARARAGGTADAAVTTTTTTVAGAEGTTDTASTVAASADPNASTAPDTGTTLPDVPAAPHVPPAAEPAQVYVAGDSLAKDLAIELVPLVAKSGVAVAQSRVKVGTGLVRPDTFDWPAQLQKDVASLKPDIVVVEFGGNDTQGILLPDGKAIQHPTDPGWSDEYARRVAAVMEYLTKDGRKLIWVGAPMARDPVQNGDLAIIRNVVVDQTAKHAGVDYVDSWDLFKSPADLYADYILIDGEYKPVRQNDGFHLNPTGVKYLAGKVNERILTELKARGATIS